MRSSPLGLLLPASGNSLARILQNRYFVEPGGTYFQGVLRGCPFRRRWPNPVGTRPGGSAGVRGAASIRAPPGDPNLKAGAGGKGENLAKSRLDPIRGSGISSSLSWISVICYLLSRPDPGVPKIIPIRLTPAYPPYGRCAVYQPADLYSQCRPCPTVSHAPTSDFLVTPLSSRISDPLFGSFSVK